MMCYSVPYPSFILYPADVALYYLQIIGRVEADPDYMPRSMDFGLNETVFQAKYCQECPEPFYKIAFMCCNINPDARY